MTLCSRLFAQRYWGPAGEAPEMFLLAGGLEARTLDGKTCTAQRASGG
jgi:hypothetical protein